MKGKKFVIKNLTKREVEIIWEAITGDCFPSDDRVYRKMKRQFPWIEGMKAS